MSRPVEYRAAQPSILGMVKDVGLLDDESSDEFFKVFWEAIERELCVYSQPSDAQEAFAWALHRSKLVYEVSEAFKRFPRQAFKGDRLSRLLLATGSDDLKNELFHLYIRMSSTVPSFEVDIYSFRDDQSYQVFEVGGTTDAFTYFLRSNANPFMNPHSYLTEEGVASLGMWELEPLLERLSEKALIQSSIGSSDIHSLKLILLAMQNIDHDADVTGHVVNHWKAVGSVFGHSKIACAHNIWETLQSVIIDSASQLLFERSASYLSSFPGIVTPSDILEIGFMVEACGRPERADDPANPWFSIATSLGKKILNNSVQEQLLGWSNSGAGRTGSSTERVRFLFCEIEPLLVAYRDRLETKPCPFNPQEVIISSILADISAGKWLKMRIALEVSPSYREKFGKIGLEVLFDHLSISSSEMVDIIAPRISGKPDKQVTKVFQACMSRDSDGTTVRSLLFKAAFAKRLNAQPSGFLFEGITNADKVVAGMGLLKLMDINVTTEDVLDANPSELVSARLLEIDMGL